MATKAEKGRVSIMTKQQKKTLNLVLTYLVIILIGCVLLFPIAWMISAAFKTNDEIFGSIALLPKSFSFQNFIDGWKSAGIYTYATYFINSFIMVIPTTLLTIASSALVAYGFARFNFPFKKKLFAILIATLMLPNSVKKYTISLALRLSVDAESVVVWGRVMAMACVAVLPLVLLFFAAQKYFVEGIATSGLKG